MNECMKEGLKKLGKIEVFACSGSLHVLSHAACLKSRCVS